MIQNLLREALRSRLPLPRVTALALLFAFAATPACTPPPAPKQVSAEIDANPVAPEIPVDATDPQRGSASAPVTVVVFGDYHCPHCRRANAMLAQLEATYGSNLRVVWKHFPQEDEDAVAAAVLASGLHHLGGDDLFWAFHDGVYSERRAGDTLQSMVAKSLDKARSGRALETKAIADAAQEQGVSKVKADLELGEKLGVTALPTLFVNGTRMVGVGSKKELAGVIDAELAATKRAPRGESPTDTYAARVRENLQRGPLVPSEAPADDDADDADVEPIDDTNFRVPVVGSPVRGKMDALVTIVEFGDFQCPYCTKAQRTLRKVAERYGDKVRFVFKNNPLPFHKRAEPASQLAMEILAKKGEDAFWVAHDSIYAQDGALDDAALGKIARAAGLDEAATLEAVKKHAHEGAIERDLFLADDVGARGTPYFYVNGRKVVGAQNYATFAAVIDEEYKQAEELVRAGIDARDVYATTIADGRVEPPPERSEEPKLRAGAKTDAPRLGSKKAAIEIHVFADFECPHCSAQADALHELYEAFPNDVTLLYHQLPLSFHRHARDAAIASLEARKQKGDTAFWQLHDGMFGDQAQLSREELMARFRVAGLDDKQLEKAFDDGRFDKRLADDLAFAEKVGAEGTPTTFIDGYVFHGAQSTIRMKKLVRRLLEEKAARTPASGNAKR